VRVAAPETLSCTLLPELIAGYNNSHPGVEVRFDDVPDPGVLAGLQNALPTSASARPASVPGPSVEVHIICADSGDLVCERYGSADPQLTARASQLEFVASGTRQHKHASRDRRRR